MKKVLVLCGACLWLLLSCGGRQEISQPQYIIPEMEAEYAHEVADDQEELVAPSLSAQRLEELYGKASVPDIDRALEQEMKKWELQKTFDMPIQVNKQVRNYIYYFSTDRKEIFGRYLARSTRYLPMIKKIFADYGLPEDLAYLAMIESGFSNRARSSANAVGMWQFIKGTAVRYGLRVDSYIDERRDPEKATQAAAKYLLDLYKQFGSWYLAAASYNCGEGRVQKEIDRNLDAKNYWELVEKYSLPSETQNYVPQMIAATIIAKNPEKYGFKRIPYQQPLQYEQVKVSEPTSLQAVAVATGTSLDDIADLNPELLRKVTPPEYSAYLVKIPPNKKDAFLANIDLARAQFPAASTMAWSRDESEDYSRSRYLTRERSRPAASSSWSQANKNGSRRQVAPASRKPAAKAAVAAVPPPKSSPAENLPLPPVRTAAVAPAPKPSKSAKTLTVAKAKPPEPAPAAKPEAAPLTASILGSSKDKKEGKAAKANGTCKTSNASKASNAKTHPEAKKKNGTTLARKTEGSNKKKNSL